jgi:hypothetical protein
MIDKDNLYKNLEFASEAYSVAEGAFPLWEAVFALIVGQILIAYFSTHMHIDQKIGLAFLGLILSTIWFILVSLNFLNADHINKKLLKIQECLRACDPLTPFIWPWPETADKKSWTLGVIITGRLPDIDHSQATTEKDSGQCLHKKRQDDPLKSTWIYRKALPGVMIVAWLILISLQTSRI